MRSGDVRTLLILGGNPVYTAPADLAFAEALAAVPNSVHLALIEDETSRSCSWHLPQAHALESWADGRAWDGTWTTAQPLIEPLYGGRSPLEVLAISSGDELKAGYDIVRQTAAEQVLTGLDFEKDWRRALARRSGRRHGLAMPLTLPSMVTRLQRSSDRLAELVAAPGPDG